MREFIPEYSYSVVFMGTGWIEDRIEEGLGWGGIRRWRDKEGLKGMAELHIMPETWVWFSGFLLRWRDIRKVSLVSESASRWGKWWLIELSTQRKSLPCCWFDKPKVKASGRGEGRLKRCSASNKQNVSYFYCKKMVYNNNCTVFRWNQIEQSLKQWRSQGGAV